MSLFESTLYQDSVRELEHKLVMDQYNQIKSETPILTGLDQKILQDKVRDLMQQLDLMTRSYQHLTELRREDEREWKLVQGCIPCSFVCDRCDIHHYRCTNGAVMYERKNPRGILCGHCYQRKDEPCYHCHQPGHLKKRCPEIKCFVCQKFGHLKKDCAQYKCTNCLEQGHFKSNCPRLKK